MPTATKPRLIFIHIPKSGGTSVLGAFRSAGIDFAFDGDGIWERLAAHPRGPQVLRRLKTLCPINTLVHFAEKHLPAEILREFVADDMWQSSFKFAFVRNPWDLLVSTYFFIQSTKSAFDRMEPDFSNVIEHSDFSAFVRQYPLIAADQQAMLSDESGDKIVDFVGRFERLEEDFAYICGRVGVAAELPHLNPSEHAPYREYYDDETRKIVERHFARDIERFGYTF